MNFDLSNLMKLIDPNTFAMCLFFGFALKYARVFMKIGNRFIPLIMLILGGGINTLQNYQHITVAVVLGGMVSGMASTGFYEMLRNLLYGKVKQNAETVGENMDSVDPITDIDESEAPAETEPAEAAPATEGQTAEAAQ